MHGCLMCDFDCCSFNINSTMIKHADTIRFGHETNAQKGRIKLQKGPDEIKTVGIANKKTQQEQRVIYAVCETQ